MYGPRYRYVANQSGANGDLENIRYQQVTAIAKYDTFCFRQNIRMGISNFPIFSTFCPLLFLALAVRTATGKYECCNNTSRVYTAVVRLGPLDKKIDTYETPTLTLQSAV